jgi:hypothetical protein
MKPFMRMVKAVPAGPQVREALWALIIANDAAMKTSAISRACGFY